MTEELPYQVIRKFEHFEVRLYPEHIVAQVLIESSFEDAGNRAFRYLFAYIAGENRTNQKVAMTAPVVQDVASMKIEMTAPVLQQEVSDPATDTGSESYRVAFVLPEGFTLENAPCPTNPRVVLRVVPESTAAVIRFNGRWSAQSYERHLTTLRTAMKEAGFSSLGAPRFARFDPPMKPWFMRHNEIMLDVESSV